MIKRGALPHNVRKNDLASTKTTGTFAPAYLKSAVARQEDSVSDVEFGEKKWVWVKDHKSGFLKAWITKEEGDVLSVRCSDDSDRSVGRDDVERVNPPKFDQVQDMASLTYLNEPSVAHNLQQRFEAGAIYTYSGLFLVAVNPYRSLSIYGQDTIKYFQSRSRDETAKPHVFATSDMAYRNMLDMREDQSILVTGESGAGKTESTKKVIQYLAAIAGQSAASPTKRHHTGLEEQILQANPILEAFGNAQTVKNDNSSRFGKFIKILFNDQGRIVGANTNWFLLEKSRVVAQASNERNYHIFYQLLAGATTLQREALLLHGPVESYEYLRHSRKVIAGVSDKDMFAELLRSFDTLGLSGDEQMSFLNIVAVILHIGNLEITSDRSGQARLPDSSQVEKVCHLLGVPMKEFSKALLTPKVKAGREWVVSARSLPQVKSSLAALSRSLYERNFGALVERINDSTTRSDSPATSFIGVLDMAGFEIFERNSFEQLCINYTNEKLQQFFNHHMFVLEQEEYAREQIDWKFVDFGLDLLPTIELIEKSQPIGLLSCLDEESVMPKATDVTFTEKMHHLWSGKSNKYRTAKFPKDGFVLTHYAAEVEYTTAGWLEKNKDPLNENVSELLCQSTNDHIGRLFGKGDTDDKTRVKKGLFRTVAQRHKEQLTALMGQLDATQPHFIRCIIPNHEKSSKKFDFPLVLDQLRCNGVLEGIRIARTGFPNRLLFSEFKQRYAILAPRLSKGYIDGQKAAHSILQGIGMDTAYYRIGLTKVFFRAGVLAELEERRESKLRSIIIEIQSISRAYVSRRLTNKRLHRKSATMLLKQDFRTYFEISQSPWWQLFMKMKPVLSATKSDREMKMRSAEIQKLEALAADREQAAQKIKEQVKKAELAQRALEDMLKAERTTSADTEALYERSRQREVVLQEDLDLALADVETLEGRCDELLSMKRDLDAQIEILRTNVDRGTIYAERLQVEKTRLSTKLNEVEITLVHNSENEARLVTAIAQKDAQIAKLEQQISANESKIDEHESMKRTLQQELLNIKTRDIEIKRLEQAIAQAILEKKAAKVLVDEMIGTSSTSELLIRKKDQELTDTKNTIAKLQLAQNEAMSLSTKQSDEIRALQSHIATLEIELSTLASANSVLKAEIEAAKTKQASQLDTSALTEQLSGLQEQLQAAQDARKAEVLSNRANLEEQTRQAESHRLSVQKLEVINGDLVKQIAKSMQEKRNLSKQVDNLTQERQGLNDERDQLKTKLLQADQANNSVDSITEALRQQLHEALERAKAAIAKASQVDVEKERFRREAMDMKARFDQLMLQRASGDGSSKKLETELSKANEKLRELLADHDLVKDELVRARAKLDHVNRLDEDLIATQVRDVTLQRDDVQKQLDRIIEEKMSIENELSSLRANRNRFTRELEDLNHELDKEHQIAKAAEKTSTNLQKQLIESRDQLEAEKQQKNSAQALTRKLQASLDAITEDLTERTEQVMSLYRAVSDDQDLDKEMSWQKKKINVTNRVDLARQLQEARQELKKAEASRLLLQTQLSEVKKRAGDIHDFDSKHQLYKSRSDSISTLDISQLPGSPTRPMSAPWTPPSTLRSGLSEPGRSRTNTLAQNFENRKILQSPESGKSDAAQLRIQALQAEVQHLQKRLERSANLKPATGSSSGLSSDTDSANLTINRLTRENKRLHELLDDGADHLDELQATQRKDREVLRNVRSKSLAEVEDNFQSLADDKINLTRSHRKSLAEMQAAKQELETLRANKSSLQIQLQQVQKELQETAQMRNNDTAFIAQLEEGLEDAQSRAETESIRAQELSETVKMYRQRAEDYFDRLELAETTVIKAAQSENYHKRQWQDAETALAAAAKDRQNQDKFIADLQKKMQEMEMSYEDGQLEFGQAVKQRSRMQQELEQYRSNHAQELEDRDQTAEQTRKVYQRELALLTSELEQERSNAVSLKEDNRSIRSNLEDLQIKQSEDNLNAATWEKDARRKENKIQDLMKELQATEAAQRESQGRVVAMLSEIRDLRLAKEEADSERAQLLQDKKAMEAKFRNLSDSTSDLQNKVNSNQSLTRTPSVIQQNDDRIQRMADKMARAESAASDAQREVLQEREANVQLYKQKVTLENEKKELQLKVVDLETKSYGSSSKDIKFLQNRIGELEKELHGQDKARLEESRSLRNTDRTIKDLENALAQREATNQRYEEKVSKAEGRLQVLQKDIESLRDSESSTQLRARKAEREASDQRERALRAEKELERYKSREELSKMTRSNTMSKLSASYGSLRSDPSQTVRSTYQPTR